MPTVDRVESFKLWDDGAAKCRAETMSSGREPDSDFMRPDNSSGHADGKMDLMHRRGEGRSAGVPVQGSQPEGALEVRTRRPAETGMLTMLSGYPAEGASSWATRHSMEKHGQDTSRRVSVCNERAGGFAEASHKCIENI